MIQLGYINLNRSSEGGWTVISDDKKYSKYYYQDFSNQHGLTYEYNLGTLFTDDNTPRFMKSIPEGNAFFAINNHLAGKMWDYDLWPTAIYKLGMRVDKRLIDTTLFTHWEKYKKSHRLLEHEDYCKMALEIRPVLPGKVLFIDEFQDMSPSHYALFEMWRDQGTFERIYIAGDPNQSIYGFRGCDPTYLINTSGIGEGAYGENIPQSHRCPSMIIDFADTVLGEVSNMTPSREGGIIEWFGPNQALYGFEIDGVIDKILILQQKFQRVMVLCRFQSQIKKWHDAFNQRGIPHLAISKKYDTWDKLHSECKHKQSIGKILPALHGFDRYHNGENESSISLDDARTFIRLIPLDEKIKSGLINFLNHKNPEKPVMVSTLIGQLSMWIEGLDPHSLIDKIAIKEKHAQSIRNLLHLAVENQYYFSPDSILLDTLHSSKGLQSPAVLIDCSFIKDRTDDVIIDPSEERRVGYVGVTRASEHVVLIEPFNAVWNPVFETAKERWHGFY
jgi:superfamily I DNA/RNA helicase